MTVLVASERPEAAAELLAVARTLSRGRLVALATEAGDLVARGADLVLVGPIGALAEAVARERPDLVLVGATVLGNEAAARLAQRLGVGCASHCLALDSDLQVERRVYGGRFLSREALLGRPRVATVALRRVDPPPADSGRTGEVRDLGVAEPPVVAVQPRPRSAVDVSRAPVVVAAGRGVRRREDLALLERLASALGGELAGTRPVTDELGWLPPDRRIGLSGRTVRPRLYVACGVSGQVEHVVGMRDAGTVVAVNSDPRAPIHAEADYSLVADLYEAVPRLLALLEGRRTG